MTDLEKTKLCAEAMEMRLMRSEIGDTCTCDGLPLYWREDDADSAIGAWRLYDPLHDDAQAMALLKRFAHWCLYDSVNGHHIVMHHDINRAIVECVAKMQAARAQRETA